MSTDEFPLAYFITWTTYGTWLPGDERGWLKKGSPIVQAPDSRRQTAAEDAMTGDCVVLTTEQRKLLHAVIVKHCEIPRWILHACNVRTNHIHVVVSAAIIGTEIRRQLKSWCNRRLSEDAGLIGSGRHGQRRWFTEKGDIKWVDDEDGLQDVIHYVNDLQ